jgi:putative spermidine/putrescine transport system ATP-binding protein
MFLGNQWLYHIDTGLGDLLATWQNCGNAACSDGEEVSLRWPADALHIVKREHREAQHG